MVSVPPVGMASRALTARLTSAEFQLGIVDFDRPEPGAADHLKSDLLAQRALQEIR